MQIFVKFKVLKKGLIVKIDKIAVVVVGAEANAEDCVKGFLMRDSKIWGWKSVKTDAILFMCDFFKTFKKIAQ